MRQEPFERDHPIAAKIYEEYKKDLTLEPDHIRHMLADLETECGIQFHGESSVKIKELEKKVKELEALNNYQQNPESEYTATQLAAKLNAIGYKGKLTRETPFFNSAVSDSKRVGIYAEVLNIGE